MRYVETGFLIQILLHKCKVEVISKLLFSSFAHKLQEDSEKTLSFLFHNHDITSLENIHPITFRKYTKHPIKYCQKKINMCEHATFFIKLSESFHKAFLCFQKAFVLSPVLTSTKIQQRFR